MAAMDTTLESFYFSNLVADIIVWSLPTKAAVQTCLVSNQWQQQAASLRTLDFDEHDDFQRHGDDDDDDDLVSEKRHKRRHKKFIKFVKGFLPFYVERKDKDSFLQKLRIHTRMFNVHGVRDGIVITDLLEYACRKGLTELDVCLDFYFKTCLSLTEHLAETEGVLLKSKHYNGFYSLPLSLIARCGESLTVFKLGCVIIPELLKGFDNQLPIIFPSLKDLSLKAVRIDFEFLDVLLSRCRSIEHLSLRHCSFENSKLYVCCSSLKSLEIKYCEVDDIRVDKALNLETFSFVSARDFKCETLVLNSSFKLKRIDVSSKSIGVFSILGCSRALEASIKAKWIGTFELYDAYLSVKFSFMGFHGGNRTVVSHATILVKELMNQAGMMISPHDSNPTFTHRLVSFVKNFTSSCNKVSLYNEFETFQALTVPRDYRSMTSEASLPLNKTRSLEVMVPNWQRLIEETDEYAELIKSLHWMEPSASVWVKTITTLTTTSPVAEENGYHHDRNENVEVRTTPVIVEEDRKRIEQRASRPVKVQHRYHPYY